MGRAAPIKHIWRDLEIKFLYYKECPSHGLALERLRQAMAEEDIHVPVKVVEVETNEQAQSLRFIGSPTILIDGQDIDAPPANAQYALTCRAYQLEDGRISPLPPPHTIRRALREARSPAP